MTGSSGKSCVPDAAVNVNSVPPVGGRREFEFEPTQIMRRKFVEYLDTDCFHFCRIPVELCCQRVEYKTYEALHKMHG
jgi:hypothetical protein